jgi:tetratricopeptide (TPR) repeat protein
MKKVVFSKQADHDIDMVPFWFHWYRNIFRADTIIITPVKLPTSSTKEIENYYRDKNVMVIPIELEYWDANRIWTIQRDLVRKAADLKNDYVALSADTDQFFEPIDYLFIQDDIVVFERVNLIADDTPGVRNVHHLALKELLPDKTSVLTQEKEFTAGFVNTLEHRDVFSTGHYTGSIERISRQNVSLKEFQIRLRGEQQFIKKIESLSFENLSGKVSWHFKRWVRILERQGRDGLLMEYERMVNTNCLINSRQIDRFKERAKKISRAAAINWQEIKEKLKKGEDLFSQNRHAEAKLRFREVLNIVPDHCHAINNLGVIATSDRDLESAEKYFEDSLDVNPFSVDALMNLGQVFNIMGRPRESIKHFMAALRIDDRDANLWNAVGECLLRFNEIEKAQIAFRKSISLNSEEKNIYRIRSLMEGSEPLWDVALKRDLEKDKHFYDHRYLSGGDNGEYHKKYSECIYYEIWKAVLDWTVQLDEPNILEIGCGPGQFAKMIFDHGITKYKGIDFSNVAIDMARSNNPCFSRLFRVDDVYTSSVFDDEYNIVIALELFEHIEGDLLVMEKISQGCDVIFSVPNFPDESHVRYFHTKDSVMERYQGEIVIESVCQFELGGGLGNRIFLIKGVSR